MFFCLHAKSKRTIFISELFLLKPLLIAPQEEGHPQSEYTEKEQHQKRYGGAKTGHPTAEVERIDSDHHRDRCFKSCLQKEPDEGVPKEDSLDGFCAVANSLVPVTA